MAKPTCLDARDTMCETLASRSSMSGERLGVLPQLVLDGSGRSRRLAALEQQVNEDAVAAIGRDAASRGMRLMQIPSASSRANMFRIVADDTPRPLWRASACDETGSPVATCSRTSTANSRRDRSESSWETIARQMLTALPIIAWQAAVVHSSAFFLLGSCSDSLRGSWFRVPRSPPV